MGKITTGALGAGVLRTTIEGKIIRADGTVVDLGVLADSGLPRSGLTFLQRLKAKYYG